MHASPALHLYDVYAYHHACLYAYWWRYICSDCSKHSLSLRQIVNQLQKLVQTNSVRYKSTMVAQSHISVFSLILHYFIIHLVRTLHIPGDIIYFTFLYSSHYVLLTYACLWHFICQSYAWHLRLAFRQVACSQCHAMLMSPISICLPGPSSIWQLHVLFIMFYIPFHCLGPIGPHFLFSLFWLITLFLCATPQ
jgi:hypothetical protein